MRQEYKIKDFVYQWNNGHTRWYGAPVIMEIMCPVLHEGLLIPLRFEDVMKCAGFSMALSSRGYMRLPHLSQYIYNEMLMRAYANLIIMADRILHRGPSFSIEGIRRSKRKEE